MQEADIVISRYFSDKERSAELLNYCFFQGKDMIKPEYLTELDGNLHALDERKKGQKRYGDQIWKVKLKEGDILVGVEHQMKVHYFMPFRQWGYELRQYEKQYYQICYHAAHGGTNDNESLNSTFPYRLNGCILISRDACILQSTL